jgi:hypothetical protein
MKKKFFWRIIGILFLFMFYSGFYVRAQIEDSIEKIDCIGADTVLASLSISSNGFMRYSTNRENGIYNLGTKKKITAINGKSKLSNGWNKNFWRISNYTIDEINEKGSEIESIAIPTKFITENFKILDVNLDQDNNIWLCTNKGVLVKTKNNWHNFNVKNSPILSDNVLFMKVGCNNDKWFITDSGISVMHDSVCFGCQKWDSINKKTTGYSFTATKCIAFDKKGNAIVGNYFGEIEIYSSGKAAPLEIAREMD